MTTTTPNLTCLACDGNGHTIEEIDNKGNVYAPSSIEHNCVHCSGLGVTQVTITVSPADAKLLQEAMHCWAAVLRDGADKYEDSKWLENSNAANHLRDKATRCIVLAPRMLGDQ